jgi:hypothetical protein
VFLPIPALKTRTVVMAVTRADGDNPLVERMLALLQSTAPATARRTRTSEKLK